MKKIAVIGSGVMGSGIAAHIANAGYTVFLFDIVLNDQSERNFLTINAIEKLKKNKILSSRHAESLIIPLNLEDNLDFFKECDWIIEVITEKLALKHDLYKKIITHRNPNAIISSNTSTIKLSELLSDMPEDFQKKFFITHFFNPPRYMKLLELVCHSKNSNFDIKILKDFCYNNLGKTIVQCYDSPGFIANRLGCYWLEISLRAALKYKLSPSLVDATVAKYLSVPKTGIFGLYDLIGLDLMKLISKSLISSLTQEDSYQVEVKSYPPFYLKLIEEGYTGKKGKGGFYRLLEQKKQELNLLTEKYEDIATISLPTFSTLKESFTSLEPIGDFISYTFLKFIHYTLIHAKSIAADIYSIDQAMKTGYNWQFGPFELIDQLGKEFLIKQFTQHNMPIPPLLTINQSPFYQPKSFLDFTGTYIHIPNNNLISLNNIKENGKPIYSSDNCNLWDIGDKVACLVLNSKSNTLNQSIFESIIEVVDFINNKAMHLVIGSDKSLFSTGADLGFILHCIENKAFDEIENFIKLGQKAFNYLKTSKQKIVSAVNGYALGGGCELLLHTHQVVAYIESYIGLVEPAIGLIPGWGGCKQMISKNNSKNYQNILTNIFMGKISNSAVEAKEMHFLNDSDIIVMNNERLLFEAKNCALAPKLPFISQNNQKINIQPEAFEILITDQNHQLVLSKLIKLFNSNLEDIDKLEKQYFVELAKSQETKLKIEKKLKIK